MLLEGGEVCWERGRGRGGGREDEVAEVENEKVFEERRGRMKGDLSK
jgi:hypothetical protein